MGEEIIVKQESSLVEMISQAVAKGADLEKLSQLLTIKERWEANEAKKAYHKAMADFKKNPPKINKDQTVKYKDVKYNHASLDNAVGKITSELSKHGLSASWIPQQNGSITITCRITHVLGHSEDASLSASADNTGSKNSIQAMGSTITYLERYTLLAILGLATSEQDGDGQQAPEFIDEAQLKVLKEGIAKLKVSEDMVLTYLGVDKLESLPKVDYQKAVSAIKAAKPKEAKK